MSVLDRKGQIVRILLLLFLSTAIFSSLGVSSHEDNIFDMGNVGFEIDSLKNFTQTGTIHTYDVSNIRRVSVQMFGAGGGGGAVPESATPVWNISGGPGGLGGAVFNVSEFDTLKIWIGEGGGSGGNGGKGGGGRHEGGDGGAISYARGGGGGGSTEILGVRPDGTEVFLAAADAGMGGGASGVASDNSVGGTAGGGGGARGGEGETVYTDPGSDGEDAEGSGYGGGYSAGRAVGGYENNSKYTLVPDGVFFLSQNHRGSGGRGGNLSTAEDGEDGRVKIWRPTIYRAPQKGLASQLTDRGVFNGHLINGTRGYPRQSITFLNTTSGRRFLNITGMFGSMDVDLRDLTIEATDSKVVVNLSRQRMNRWGVATEHDLFLPNNNDGKGVRICPYARKLSDVDEGCINEVVFNKEDLGSSKEYEPVLGEVEVSISDGEYVIKGIKDSGAETIDSTTGSTVDPPNLVIHSPPNATIGDETPWLNVTADKDIAGWEYRVDSGSRSVFSPNITLPVLSSGKHNVTVWAEGPTGAENSSTVYFSISLKQPKTLKQPKIRCEGCISPRRVETGEEVEISPYVEDKAFDVDSVDVCLDRSCSEIICGSADCTYSSDEPEKNDVYVRVVYKGGDSIVERIGGMFIGLPLEASCSEDEVCLSGNCEGGICRPSNTPPYVQFNRGEEEIDALNMGVLEGLKVNITVSNFLSSQDSLTLEFGGRAATGIVDGNVSETSDVDCNSESSVCNVSISSNEEKNLETTIKAISVGSGALQVKAVSKSTGLEAEDIIQINTRPRNPDGSVSAPGMTISYLFALLFLSSIYIATRWRN